MMNRNLLWAAHAAAAASDGELRDASGRTSDGWVANGVSIDSRTLVPGDLFVALKDVRDGHEFAASAFAAGASAALVSHIPEDLPDEASLLVVKDVLEGLRALALSARERSAARRVAVTGSVGKTSVKEMLRTALASDGRTHASERSYNNHWGVPLTLARMPQGTDYGVFEIGMNHAGEIEPLTQLVKPHVAIVTTVGVAHLENFDSVDDIAEEKASIFLGLEQGIAFINRDNPYFELMSARAREYGADTIVTFGVHEEADARLTDYRLTPKGVRAVAQINGRDVPLALKVSGAHQALNAVVALAAAHRLGAPLKPAAEALAAFAPLRGRGEILEIAARDGSAMLIDESYNANPVSMSAAIEALGRAAPEAGGRRIAILGDMLELGEAGPAMHAGLADQLIDADVDAVFTSGDLMTHMRDGLPAGRIAAAVDNADALVEPLRDYLRAGDVVMAKGSNGSRIWAVVDALTGKNEKKD